MTTSFAWPTESIFMHLVWTCLHLHPLNQQNIAMKLTAASAFLKHVILHSNFLKNFKNRSTNLVGGKPLTKCQMTCAYWKLCSFIYLKWHRTRNGPLFKTRQHSFDKKSLCIIILSSCKTNRLIGN